LDTFVSDDSINRLGDLYTKKFEKLVDVLRIAAQRVGDSGVFDEINRLLSQAAESLFDWVDSPGFRQQASRISDALGGVIRNVGRAGVGFLQGVTGNENVG
jgi:hypothetical protein